jgi:phenylpropionate dioxygenase-like ring-hydroxylating dioxygenase large terminal subunit
MYGHPGNAEDLERQIDGLVIDDIEKGLFKTHRRAFVDPLIFELERERVFDRTWQFIGHESEVAEPGAFRTQYVAGRSLILVRGDDGTIRALLNHCRHRGTQLCSAQAGKAKFFRCPYHAWSYNSRGQLTAVPGADAYGPGWKKEDHGLHVVPRIDNYRGFLFVSFDPKIEPLAEWLRGAREYLDLVADQAENGFEVIPGTHRFSMRCNWKLILENAVDNYHFPVVHNRHLQHMRDIGVTVGPAAKGDVFAGKSLGHGHGVSEHQLFAAFGRLAGHWGPNLPEWTKEPVTALGENLEKRVGPERTFRMTKTNRNLRIFPSLFLQDHISPILRKITPRSCDFTEIQEWSLAPRGEGEKLRELRVWNNCIQVGPAGFVTSDDVEVLGLTQDGLMNPEMEWIDNSRGMKIGRAFASDEQQMRGLYRHWHELMTLNRVPHSEDV